MSHLIFDLRAKEKIVGDRCRTSRAVRCGLSGHNTVDPGQLSLIAVMWLLWGGGPITAITPIITCYGLLEGADRELRKSEDATHFATDGPAPRHYDGHTAAARVRVAGFVGSEYSNALVGDGVPGFRRARRTSTALSVACSSLRLKLGEQLLCCSHVLHSWHSLLCGCHSCDSDGLALTGPQSLVLRLV